MTTISELHDAVSKLNIREKLPEFIKKTQYELVLKIQEQHKFGLLGTGSKITPSYKSKYYSGFKATLNPAAGYGIPDIHVKGAYDAEIYVKVNGEDYEIDSAVDYAKSASIVQYGNDLNIPTDENKDAYWNEALVPEIQAYITETTGLTFS